ncbi:hypothetical protein [Brumimicrobium oceani]|nr:hypothetical protein [Brumimicrobium oceani]
MSYGTINLMSIMKDGNNQSKIRGNETLDLEASDKLNQFPTPYLIRG